MTKFFMYVTVGCLIATYSGAALAVGGGDGGHGLNPDHSIRTFSAIKSVVEDEKSTSKRRALFFLEAIELNPVFGVPMFFYGVNPQNGKVRAFVEPWATERPDLFEKVPLNHEGGIDSADEFRRVLNAIQEAARTSKFQVQPPGKHRIRFLGRLQTFDESDNPLGEAKFNFDYSNKANSKSGLLKEDIEALGAPVSRDLFEAIISFDLYGLLTSSHIYEVQSHRVHRIELSGYEIRSKSTGKLIEARQFCKKVDRNDESVIIAPERPQDDIGLIGSFRHSKIPGREFDQSRNLPLTDCE